MYIQLAPRSSPPDAHNIATASTTSISTAHESSQMNDSTSLAVSQVKPNISGYVIIGVVLTILILVLIGVFTVRRCGVYRLFGCIYKRKISKSAGSSLVTLNDTEKVITPQMSSRTGSILRVPPLIHSRTPAVAAQNDRVAVPIGNNGESSAGRANESLLSDTHNNGITRQANQTTSDLPTTDFMAPTSHHKHFFDERFMTAAESSTNRTIRPHGIPLTPVPEDASATFPPYFEVDEQTLYGTSQNSLIQH